MIARSLLIILCTSGPALMIAQGIAFERASFEELLAQAREEDKLIFIDAYTTWCGPCKMMDAQVFPDPEVGELYNARFINAKFDMEKGEGPSLARRFGVSAYPSYLFVNGQGELVHKGIGFIPKPALLKLADVAVSDESLGALGSRYEEGERSASFIGSYAAALSEMELQGRADEIVSNYLDGQDDWSTPEHLRLILASPGAPGDKRALYLAEHAEEVDAVAGTGSTAKVMEDLLLNAYHRQHRQRSLVEPTKIEPYLRRHGGNLADRLVSHYHVLYYSRANDDQAFLDAALAYADTYPIEDFAELNGLAWGFFERTDDPELLQKAIGWAERSVDLYAYYPNLDTLAWLYHKTGQQEKAEATAHKAIEQAKAAGLDYSDTERILQ